MKLIYRGITYERHPSSSSARSFPQVREPGAAYNLRYRGVTYRIDPNALSASVLAKPVAYKLIYRSVAYLVNRNVRQITVVT